MAACFLTGYLPVSHLSSLLSFCHRRGVHLSQPSPALFDCHPAVKFVWGKERGFLDPKVCACMCKVVGAKREHGGCGIVTFVHLLFHLSGAVITATGGLALVFGALP